MKLRHGLALGIVLVAAGLSRPALARDEAAAVKSTVMAYYTAYAALDTVRYRALLTDDYALLEGGTLLDAAGDIALLPRPDPNFKRTDAFDFRNVKVDGKDAYAVYFLKSEIRDSQGVRKKEWLESMILRCVGKDWRVALLHSTRVTAPGGTAAP